MKWFNRKNNLDEMQELKLLKIESKGFWLGFFGLFAAILVQIALYGSEFADRAAGEFIVFLGMGIYLIGGCLKNGIWDRHLQATPAVNIGCSLLAAALAGLFNAVMSYREYHKIGGAFAVFVAYFFMLGTLLSVIMCACSALYKRRRRQLEAEDRDESLSSAGGNQDSAKQE